MSLHTAILLLQFNMHNSTTKLLLCNMMTIMRTYQRKGKLTRRETWILPWSCLVNDKGNVAVWLRLGYRSASLSQPGNPSAVSTCPLLPLLLHVHSLPTWHHSGTARICTQNMYNYAHNLLQYFSHLSTKTNTDYRHHLLLWCLSST